MSEESSSSIRMALGIVGLNGDYGDTFVPVVVRQLLDPALVHLRYGAVITGKNHHQDRTGGIIAQLVDLAVDTRKREVRSR